jgi:N12 class adenine-specific DNA methylase
MAGVWRILQTPNKLLGQVGGAGKTYTTVAAAMELKRLGLLCAPILGFCFDANMQEVDANVQ